LALKNSSENFFNQPMFSWLKPLGKRSGEPMGNLEVGDLRKDFLGTLLSNDNGDDLF
jgi:hypothetical protein